MYFTMRGLCCVMLLLAKFASFAQAPVAELKNRLKTQSDNNKINTCFYISQAYAQAEPDSAVAYCNKGIRLAEKTNNSRGQALLLLQLGRINAMHQHTQLARRFDDEALSIYRRLNDQQGIARAYDELGLLDGMEQNIPSAMRDLSHALNVYQSVHDSTGVIETYYKLGMVYDKKGDTDKALAYYKKALEKYERRAQKPEAYFTLLERIGHMYLKKGDSALALDYLEKGVKSADASSGCDSEITLLNEEGKIYEQGGKKTRALQYYKQALKEAKRFGRPAEVARALINIAGILKKERADQSISELKEALKIAVNLHEPKLQATIYEALASAYRQEKDYEEALRALEEQHRLIDSIMNADTAKDIAALDSSYELERSRSKIQSLQRINKIKKTELNMGYIALAMVMGLLVFLWWQWRRARRLNMDLKASNRIKDTLFSIIGHDLKGPAGSAAQLFALMETEDFTEAERKVMIAELRKQTTASFELLNSLFEWGRSQMQGVQVELGNFCVQPIIKNNISVLSQQAASKDIIVYNHIPEDYVLYADHNHFDFIIRNLLSNAIKFTGKNGLIEIGAQAEKDNIIFSVKDNGKGISMAQQKEFLKGNLGVSFGTSGEKGSGLGLLLTKEFLKANSGRIWLESEEGKGTTFYFTLPKGTTQVVATQETEEQLA